MFILPKNVSHDVRVALQPNLAEDTLERALMGTNAAVMRLFGAEQAALVFESEGGASGVVALDRRERGYEKAFIEEFFKDWYAKDIHERVKRDLVGRLASISYSAFSWPYGRVELDEDVLKGTQFIIPRDYTIFLPISSSLLLRNEEDTEFFGYIALFYDAFPSISDDTVQLIMTLPGLLSEISAGYLRCRPA